MPVNQRAPVYGVEPAMGLLQVTAQADSAELAATLANDLAALNLPPEELERRRHQAEQDAACLLKQLGTFIDQGYVHLLRLQERELFADSLAAYARKVSDADVQSVRATMDGIANGTTTL